MTDFGLTVNVDELAEAVADCLTVRRGWATVESLAVYLGCSVRRVRDLRERGLPARKIGKGLLFDLDEVDDWIRREGLSV